MLKFAGLIFLTFLMSCSSSTDKKSPLVVKTVLSKELKEISGITAVGDNIWAITDKPRARVFKLDATGKLLQTVNVMNVEAADVEAVSSDKDFVYLGDVGDNTGDRLERKIIKIAISKIPAGAEVQLAADTINFTFPDEATTTDKKQNNFDCESLLSFKDSLYVFTKDREDKETKLYVIPKTPGNYVARYINTFNSDGLVTDAAVNKSNTELALIGYHKGHVYPFIYLFTGFKGNDFFSGEQQKIELANKDWDWQLEGITYNNKDIVYFSCEGTEDVPATFYGINRDDIFKLKKKKEKKKSSDDDDEGQGLTKKGHLKM
ncbi:MAG: hypothetical protein M3040_06250 [Bacteroidota bacterium]|nr:hypothetical protein [Bacteroidota bacterium]